MALKTFNLDDAVYQQFSEYCKKNGISMSKKIENFLRAEVDKIKPNGLKLSDEGSKEHSFRKYC